MLNYEWLENRLLQGRQPESFAECYGYPDAKGLEKQRASLLGEINRQKAAVKAARLSGIGAYIREAERQLARLMDQDYLLCRQMAETAEGMPSPVR